MANQVHKILRGWQETTLEEVAELSKSQWNPGDTDSKYIGLEHINAGELSINGFGASGNLESNKFFFRTGDILFGKLRPYFRKVWKAKFDGICSTDIWVIRNKEGYEQDFLFYFFANPSFINKSMGASKGTHMPRADWDFLSNSRWCFPPLLEQGAIAAVLSSLDNKIELLREQNKTLEATALTIFKEQIILKSQGFLPEGWVTGGLSEIANFLNGIALQKYPAMMGADSFPAIKIKELNVGITDATDRVSKEVPEQYIIHDGDILFSWSGSLEIVIWQHGDGALNQHLFKVTSEKYPKWFYYFWLLRHLPIFRTIAANKATTMGHIQRYHLDKADVVIPDDATIKKLNALIEPIFNKIILNNSQIGSLTKLRDTILPKLMKGEVRVAEFKN